MRKRDHKAVANGRSDGVVPYFAIPYPNGDHECDDPLALMRGGPLVDLIAVQFVKRTIWALRIGSATFLGVCEPQVVSSPPVRNSRPPLNWLRSGCEGMVPLTDEACEQQHVLLRFRSLAAEAVRHEEQLRRIDSRPWTVPKILVPREWQAA